MTEAAAPARDPLARLKDELSSLEKVARERLKGSQVEQLADKAGARLKVQVESTVDAVLDRAGLVRKAKVPAVVTAPAQVVVAEPASATPVDPDEQGCVGQVA